MAVVLCNNERNLLSEEPMNDQNNAPMSPEPSGFSGWFSTWMDAVTKPNEQTFAAMAASPNAKMSTAFLWVFLGSLVNFFVATLMQGVIMARFAHQFDLDGLPRTLMGGGFLSVVCGAPIGAITSVVFFALFTGVVQWVAKMFGGKGTFEQLAYVFAAISLPVTLVSSLLTLLAAIPYFGACFGLLGLVLAIYVIVLEVTAIKGVNQFGWGEAVGAFFLPGIVLFCCMAAVIAGLVSLLIPVIRDVVPQINF